MHGLCREDGKDNFPDIIFHMETFFGNWPWCWCMILRIKCYRRPEAERFAPKVVGCRGDLWGRRGWQIVNGFVLLVLFRGFPDLLQIRQLSLMIHEFAAVEYCCHIFTRVSRGFWGFMSTTNFPFTWNIWSLSNWPEASCKFTGSRTGHRMAPCYIVRTIR